jgi:REP element-mobilizing transposase RayT
MARRPRAFTDGIFHISSHGSDLRHLFLSDLDRDAFLERIAIACERFELGLLSYVLMGNHYHLLLRTPDARASRALQWLHTAYSRDHNRRYARTAHLFRAHAMSRQIESDEDLVGTCRYIARNPVEANLVRDPLDWPWGSARAHAGLEPPRIPLEESHFHAALGGHDTWRANYVDHIRRPSADVRGGERPTPEPAASPSRLVPWS